MADVGLRVDDDVPFEALWNMGSLVRAAGDVALRFGPVCEWDDMTLVAGVDPLVGDEAARQGRTLFPHLGRYRPKRSDYHLQSEPEPEPEVEPEPEPEPEVESEPIALTSVQRLLPRIPVAVAVSLAALRPRVMSDVMLAISALACPSCGALPTEPCVFSIVNYNGSLEHAHAVRVRLLLDLEQEVP